MSPIVIANLVSTVIIIGLLINLHRNKGEEDKHNRYLIYLFSAQILFLFVAAFKGWT
ncbi:hypothetical protein SFC65_19530 [Priestia filamentosa]|uniref:hypothetical protein n=1 Tax=Priestia filamentosa TaxID=1402861 RepID=UPI003981D65B